MLARLLTRVMDWALAKNGGGIYEGEDSPKWAYTIRAPDGSAYLSRLLLPRVRLPFGLGDFRPMLHHFHRPDEDREKHNHPWKRAFSLVLCGAYDEERLAGDPNPHRYMSEMGQCNFCAAWRGECPGHAADVDEKKVRWFNFLRDTDYHRVTRLHGDVWTLFVSGPRTQDWGFLTEDGVHVPWKEFLAHRAEQVEQG